MPSSPRTQGKRPADFTGLVAERQAAEKEAELRESANRMTLMTAQQQADNNTLVDYTGSDEPLPQVEVREVESNSPYRIIRVNTKIENMTYGRDVIDPGDYDNKDENLRRPAIMGSIPMYTFEEGRPYRVSVDMAEHLQRLGYIAYIGA